MDDRARMELLRRHERKALGEIEADLAAKDRARTGASTVGLMNAVIKDVIMVFFVLFLLRNIF